MNEQETPKCRCGTGNFCPRHRRCGKSSYVHGTNDSESAFYEERQRIQYQVCGGGRRVIRKTIGNV